ncbi:MAG: AAA family ATPase [Bacilli bacterium]
MSNKIIAIVGMCGAGKSVASDILENLNYKKVYFGGVTMDKLTEENLEITPENEKMMREKLRHDYGMGAYAIILLPKIKALSKDNNVVLDGLYSWDELKILKEELGNNLKVVAIITDKKIRYQRLSIRKVRPLTKEEASKRDISEIENIAKAGPIAYADYYIINNSSIESYKERLIEVLEDIEKEDDK